MTPATNSAALQLPEVPVRRPQLRLLEGRVSESVLVGRALSGSPRGRAAEEELYRRYRPPGARLAARLSEPGSHQAGGRGAGAVRRAVPGLPFPQGPRGIGGWPVPRRP